MKGHPNNIVGQVTYIISEQLGAPHGVAQQPPLQGVGQFQLSQAVSQTRLATEAVAGSSSTAVDGLHHHLLQVVTAPAGYQNSFFLTSPEAPDIRNILGITFFFCLIQCPSRKSTYMNHGKVVWSLIVFCRKKTLGRTRLTC